MTKPQLFHCLRYTDANRGIDFLTALGFTEVFVARDPSNSSLVQHAQLRWRDNGGVMLGSARDDGKGEHFGTGGHVCNLVVESDDQVDELLRRAVAAGGSVADEPSHPPHGGRTAGVLDFDGNYWNIDSYSGE